MAMEGVIGLWAGEPDVPTPAFIADAAMRALAEGHTFYTHNRGIPPLRKAIAHYLQGLYGVRVDDDRISVTSAGMNAVQLVCQAMLTAGDHAIAITPSWPNIMRAMRIAGADVSEVPLASSANGWSLDLAQVFATCEARTKLIYLASPGNPSGWMIPPEDARALLAFARERGIAILSDEVYHRLVYDRKVAFSFLEIAQPDDPVFVVNSFSKAWAMTGWRLGWLIYPQGMMHIFEKLVQFNTSGGQAFLQYGAIAALTEGEPFVKEFLERCRTGRAIAKKRLDAIAGVKTIPSSAAFYAMFEVDGVTDTLAFCKDVVLKARVGLAPGVAFGAGGERMIRLCYAKTPESLNEALDRLERFILRGESS
jgi:aspartate aminotransferase